MRVTLHSLHLITCMLGIFFSWTCQFHMRIHICRNIYAFLWLIAGKNLCTLHKPMLYNGNQRLCPHRSSTDLHLLEVETCQFSRPFSYHSGLLLADQVEPMKTTLQMWIGSTNLNVLYRQCSALGFDLRKSMHIAMQCHAVSRSWFSLLARCSCKSN